MFKKVIAGALSTVICCSTILSDGFSGLKAATPSSQDPLASVTDVSLKGTNSFGSYIADSAAMHNINTDATLYASAAEAMFQIGNLGFGPQTGDIAVSSTQTAPCSVVISFLDDKTGEVVYEVTANAAVGNNVTTCAKADLSKLPDFYVIEAKLVNAQNVTLSNTYKLIKYTEEVQRISAKTVEDFVEEQVVNFDESEDTNFLVLNEKTVQAETTENENIPVTLDYDENAFVFEHISDEIRSLQRGDYFYIQPTEVDIVAIAVEEVSIDGDCATITGNNEIEDMFDFIKLETRVSDDISEPVEDVSEPVEDVSDPVEDVSDPVEDVSEVGTPADLADSITEELSDSVADDAEPEERGLFFHKDKDKHEEKKSDNNGALKIERKEGGAVVTYSVSPLLAKDETEGELFKNVDKKNLGVSGSIGIYPSVEYFKEGSKEFYELNLRYEFSLDLSISDTYTKTDTWFKSKADTDPTTEAGTVLDLPIGSVSLPLSVPGLFVDFSLKFVIEFSGKITFHAEYTFTQRITFDTFFWIFPADLDIGPVVRVNENLSKFTVEGTLTIKAVGSLGVDYLKIATISLSVSPQIKISASAKLDNEKFDGNGNTSYNTNVFTNGGVKDDKCHNCDVCLTLSITPGVIVEGNLKILKKKIIIPLFKSKADPVWTGYMSMIAGEITSGISKCPNYNNRVTFKVQAYDLADHRISVPLELQVGNAKGTEIFPVKDSKLTVFVRPKTSYTYILYINQGKDENNNDKRQEVCRGSFTEDPTI